jgi:hypothetical protein
MSDAKAPRFLEWAREIQALAQTGQHFARMIISGIDGRRLMEIAADMISQNTGIDICAGASLQRPDGYATPKIDVRAAVFSERKLLMVRERLDGGWTLPGGWVM